MAQKFLNGIDLTKTYMHNAAIQVLASAPSSPVLGQIYFDSALLGLRVWDGTAWVERATDALLLGGQNSAYHRDRGNHTGTQTASTISNFDTQVRTSRLDQMAAPTAAVSLNSQRLTNMANPTSGSDGVNLTTLQSYVQGVEQRLTADYATTAALPTLTYSNGTAGVGATLTATANAALAVDGQSPTAGSLVLVKDQASAFQNGLYTVTQAGSAGAPFILTRHTSLDESAEITGALIAIEAGTANVGRLYLLTATSAVTVGTTALNFTYVNGPTTYTGSNGVNVSGLNITGVADPSGGLTVGASGFAAGSSIPRIYRGNVGDGTSTSITVTHNLNTRDVQVSLIEAASPYNLVETDVQAATVNTVTLIFTVAPTTNQYRVLVVG